LYQALGVILLEKKVFDSNVDIFIDKCMKNTPKNSNTLKNFLYRLINLKMVLR
jgi:hypothetical protein